MRRRAKLNDAPLSQKIPKAVWRGVMWTNRAIRSKLLEEAEGKDWSDVLEIDWDERKNMIQSEDFCRYMFVVHTEGGSWSGE